MIRWSVAAALLVSTLVLAQEKVQLNRVTRVTVTGDAVEITGSRQPSFTTFTMSDPARLVVDVADAIFVGVPEVIDGQGAITGVKTASYGSTSASIARVLIGFDRNVETDIEARGNTLIVRLLRGRGEPTTRAKPETPPEEAAEVPTRAQQEQAAREAARRAEDERKAQAQAAREAALRAEAERKAQQDAAGAAARGAEAERKAQAEAARRAQQEAQRAPDKQRTEETARRQAEAEAKRRAEEERLRQEREAKEAARRAEEERARKAEAQRQAALAAKEAAEDERRRQRAEAEEAARRAEEDRERQEATHRAEQDRLRQQQEARRAELEAKKAAEEERRHQEQAARKAELESKKVAEDERRRQQAEGRAAERRPTPAAGHNTVALVGFRPHGNGARVFVRTEQPAEFRIREADARTVIVTLEHTRIGSQNNARALDTSFFGTPVIGVHPVEAGGEVRVEIRLREQVPYQARQEGPELVLEFEGQ